MDLATRISSAAIKFQQISEAVAYRLENSDRRTPTEVLASLDCSPLTPDWGDFFQTAERLKEFNLLSHLKKTAHGEGQLILHVDRRGLEKYLDALISNMRRKYPTDIEPTSCSRG